jgi:hypothetical protein
MSFLVLQIRDIVVNRITHVLSRILILQGTKFFKRDKWLCPPFGKTNRTPNQLTIFLQIEPNIGQLKNTWSSDSRFPQRPTQRVEELAN